MPSKSRNTRPNACDRAVRPLEQVQLDETNELWDRSRRLEINESEMKLVRTLEIIEIISPATRKPQQRRIAILQRDDGHFSFAEEYAYQSEYEGEVIAEGWHRPGPSEGIFDSAEAAEEAGRYALFSKYRGKYKTHS